MEEMSFPQISVIRDSGTDYSGKEQELASCLPPYASPGDKVSPHIKHSIACTHSLRTMAQIQGRRAWERGHKKEGIITHQGLECNEIYTLSQP